MKSSNILRQVLNGINPGLYHIHTRRLSQMTSGSRLIDYSPIKNVIGSNLSEIKMMPEKDLPILDLTQPVVRQVAIQDIKTNGFGNFIVGTTSQMTIKYGDYGIMPSRSVSPSQLLKHTFQIPPETFGILSIQNHVPFLISSEDLYKSTVINLAELEPVIDQKDFVKKCSVHVVCDFGVDDAKRLALTLQTRIYRDYKKENFYEEVTSRVYPPTIFNPSSGTLMNFEVTDPGQPKDETTAMHYHPGQRSLHIFTTNKRAGVTLNFCGVAENPDERKDSEVHLEFPPNSYIILNFPPYTHHKFHGEFVCMSVHPREGKNLIQALQSGNLSGGFLESATVFSRTSQTPENWELSMPEAKQTTPQQTR